MIDPANTWRTRCSGDGETSEQAMAREFREETGYDNNEIVWQAFCHYDCPSHGTVLDFFCASRDAFPLVRRSVDEWPAFFDMITQVFVTHGWTDLWYANPFAKGARPTRFRVAQHGPRWHAGVWTGPGGDLLCLKPSRTTKEANRFLSPPGETPIDAVENAIRKLKCLKGTGRGRRGGTRSSRTASLLNAPFLWT